MSVEREYNWDDVITEDATEFPLLPEGDYDFEVESYERARHPGSDKLPPCNKAIVKIRIEEAAGTVYINHNLFLHSKTEGMLSAFFAAIGMKKKNEPMRMDWNRVPGGRGRCKVGIREYKENKYNEIKRFYPKEDNAVSAGYKAGDF